jgi:hypothetical protein
VLDQVERNCDSCRVRERVLPVPCMWWVYRKVTKKKNPK